MATTVLTPLALAKDGMLSIEACAALGLAQLCAMALRVLVGYGARCRQEADRPLKVKGVLLSTSSSCCSRKGAIYLIGTQP